VLYGAPYAWYVSGKIIVDDTGQTASHYTKKDYKKLALDTAIWTVIIVAVIAAFKGADSYLYANTRY
jgi:hypothetical protein